MGETIRESKEIWRRRARDTWCVLSDNVRIHDGLCDANHRGKSVGGCRQRHGLCANCIAWSCSHLSGVKKKPKFELTTYLPFKSRMCTGFSKIVIAGNAGSSYFRQSRSAKICITTNESCWPVRPMVLQLPRHQR
jgi:hypothetical protein